MATPAADPSKAVSMSATIAASLTVSVSPTAATVALGGTQAFQAQVTGAQDATVTWDVSGWSAEIRTLGTILNSQTDPDNTTYTAPAALPPGGSGDCAGEQQCQSEYFRVRNDHVRDGNQRHVSRLEHDARGQPEANLHRAGQLHLQSEFHVDGQRRPGRKFECGPNLRGRVQSVPAGFG